MSPSLPPAGGLSATSILLADRDLSWNNDGGTPIPIPSTCIAARNIDLASSGVASLGASRRPGRGSLRGMSSLMDPIALARS